MELLFTPMQQESWIESPQYLQKCCQKPSIAQKAQQTIFAVSILPAGTIQKRCNKAQMNPAEKVR